MPPLPYAGDPRSFPAFVDVPNGGDPPGPVLFQTAYEGTLDRTAFLYPHPLMAWSPVTPSSAFASLDGITDVSWDPGGSRWVLMGFSTGSAHGFYFDTLDGGRTWNQLATGITGLPESMATHAGDFLMVQLGGTVYYDATLSVFTAGFPGGVTTNMFPSIAFWFAPANQYVIVGANSPTTHTFNGGVALLATGTFPSSTTTALPSNWISGSTSFGPLFVAQDGAGNAVVVGGGITPGTDVARVLQINFSSFALHYTDVTPSLLSGQIVTGFAYQAATTFWGMSTWDGTTGRVYTSPDLSTWTQVSTFAFEVTGLEAAGPVWAVTAPYTYSSLHSGTTVLLSADQGADWHQAQIFIGGTPINDSFLGSNGQQLILVAGGSFGQSVAISKPAGLL